jgi:hypothetical protein
MTARAWIRRFTSVVALAAAALALPIGGSTSPPAAAVDLGQSGKVTFGVPRVVDPVHMYGEPDIKVAPNGAIHVSGPQGTGTQRSIWNVSKDNGDTWRVVQQLPTGAAAGPNKSSVGPGGGDTEIAIDHNGKVYYDDLWALMCFTAATTTDNGATVTSSPAGCSRPPADRQWMALFDPSASDHPTSPYTGAKPLIYLVYDGFSGAQVDMSTDGLTWTNAGTYANNADGFPVVDQQTGKFLALVTAAGKDANHNGTSLVIGTPSSTGALTFTTQPILNDMEGSYGLFFPVLVEDTSRNVYAIFGEDNFNSSNRDCPGKKDYCYNIVYTYASAADGWKTWSPLKRINKPPAATNIMSWAAAGGPGRIDVAWYGNPKRVHPSDKAGQAWQVYMAQIDDANTDHPKIEQAQVSPHPAHYDDVCLLGTGCISELGNRNLADFMQVAIDRDGRARVVYNDTSNGLIQPNVPTQLDHAGGALVTVGTQSTGRNAWTGEPLAPLESTDPITAVTDPAGDALFKPIGGTNVPALDITGTALRVDGNTLHVVITTAGNNLAGAAQTGGGTAAQLVARWQMGNTLYYAGVEASAAQATHGYAGESGVVDLCSVSACSPHVVTYPAPPAGGTTVTATATGAGPTVYDIAVPITAVGSPKANSVLEEVSAYSFVSATPVEVPITNPQAFVDLVPLEIDGTRSFNFSPSANAAAAVQTGGAPTVQAARSRRLPATGSSMPLPLRLAAMVSLVAALGLRRLTGTQHRRRPAEGCSSTFQ